MDDIFLDDPRQSSAQTIARNQKEKKAPKRRLREYLADLIIKSLLFAVIFSLDFTLFAEAGSYNLFTPEQILTSEAVWIYGAITIFSFAILFLFSFSLTLQNFTIGLSAAFLLLALFNQFALFDQSSLLAAYFGTDRSAGAADIFNNYSHLAIAAAFVVFVFIFLTFARRSTQAYFLGILLLIQGGLLSEAYFNPVSRAFDTKAALNDESTHPDSRNFVFIALENAPSYFKLRNIREEGKNTVIGQAADNLLGFYQQNNFTYYPYAYTAHTRNPYLNMAEILNLNQEKSPEKMLLSDVIMNGYWDFKHLNNEKLYLRSNRIFDIFHKKDYNLRIYQSRGIELCTINSRLAVNRCVEKVGLPTNLDSLPFSLPSKTALLAAQWLESTGIIPDIDPLLGIASAFNRNVAPLHFPTKQLKSYNAFKTLDLIVEDIAEDRGNNAYFTLLDFPGNLFMYDSLCNLKPISRWISAQDQNISLAERHQALAEQTNCLYGRLENFMQKLQTGGNLEHTTVIILGLNTPFSSTPGLEKDIFKSIQDNKQTGMAIFDPLKNQADIDYQICTVSALLDNFLNKHPCTELENFAVTDQLKTEILTKAQKQKLNNRQIEKARSAFKNWYASWAADNQVKNIMEEEIIPLEKLPDSAEAVPEREIKNAPVAEKTEELPPETPVQTLSETAAEERTNEKTSSEETPIAVEDTSSREKNKPETPVTADAPQKETTPPVKVNPTLKSDNPAEEKTLPKPEQLKKEFKQKEKDAKEKPATTQDDGKAKVSVEVKVIDHSAGNDVIPPFLLGDLQYKPAESEETSESEETKE